MNQKPRPRSARSASATDGGAAWAFRGLMAFLGTTLVSLECAGADIASPSAAGIDGNPVVAVTSNPPRPAGPLTFTRDIAPIIHQHCSGCHRPDQSAPFSLLTYPDLAKRLRDIADVTVRRSMPPWPLQPGHGDFAGDRRLSAEVLGTLQKWIREGGVEGDPKDLPPMPRWDSQWQLGKPDLVVEAPPFTLDAEGSDLYHNFVVPIPINTLRHVRGVEFRPGNGRVVHHAFVQVDESHRSRRLAARQSPPGFDGMESLESAVMPGGQLLGFQPGKVPSFSPDGLAWDLRPGTDLVLQVHMNRTGRREVVQPSVAFYFTDQAPTNRCYRLKLAALNLDIPAGVNRYQIRQAYTLPVDVRVLRISAHAHYLGKDLKGYAILPSGLQEDLIRIPDWDFKWQGDYGYAHPVRLPKGSVLTLDYTYDNSAGNPRNPSSPPRRIRWGLESKDEMGELTLQLLPDNEQDWSILATDFSRHHREVSRDFFQVRLESDPQDALAQRRLGRILAFEGRMEEAVPHLIEAVRLDSKSDEPHSDLGNIYLRQGRLTDAFEEFRSVVRLNPEDGEAFGSLGFIALRSGKTKIAQAFLERALQLNPADATARKLRDSIPAGPP